LAAGSARASSFSRFAQRSLALRPAHSRCHRIVARLPEGFNHFVSSVVAPVLPAGAVRRVGLAPTGKRRLCTAHAKSGLRITLPKAVARSRFRRRHRGHLRGRLRGVRFDLLKRYVERLLVPWKGKANALCQRALAVRARNSSADGSVTRASYGCSFCL